MGSGKSTAALQLNFSLKEAEFKPLLIKPKIDTRTEGTIKSRIGLEEKCLLFSEEVDLISLIPEKVTHVICDEAQFLNHNEIIKLCELVDDYGIDVYCFGLRTAYNGELFEGSAALFALADDLIELPLIFKDGKKTIMHIRYIDGKPIFAGDPIHIGDIKEDYKSVSRQYYFKTMKENKRRMPPIDFTERVKFRSDRVVPNESVTEKGLYWVEGDEGSFDGPRGDWKSHNEKIIGRVKKFGTCVQAGGNLGMYPKMLSTRFKTVYTFEPDPLNFYCLTLNNTYDNVIKINAGLGIKNQLIGINVQAENNLGMNKTVEGDPGGYIPMFTVDQLALRDCDLIWFDIEGAEKDAVLGAAQTIMQFKPLIALETVVEETRAFLVSIGYENIDRSVSDSIFEFKG
jgi:thymidine kinase